MAQATGASFFLSNDNKPHGPHDVIYRTRTLDMAVRPLTHQDVLFLGKSVGKLSLAECQEIHDQIRRSNQLERMHPDIKACMQSSFRKFIREDWFIDFLEFHTTPQATIDRVKNHLQSPRMPHT